MTTRTTRRSILIPLTLAAGLTACGARTEATMTDALDQSGPKKPRLRDMMDQGTVVRAATPSAKQFADLATKNDAFAIAAARLAQSKSSSPAIRAYAAKMIAAHAGLTARITKAATAARPAIVPDGSSTQDYDAKLAELRTLSGAAFDQAYVAGQIHEHHVALSLYELYARGGEDANLKAAAIAIVPIVKSHIAMAEALAGK